MARSIASHDWAFGASVSLFGSGGMPITVGACNKNEDFYALTANPLASSPLWTDVIAAPHGTIGSCFASADWDAPAGDLYLSGGATGAILTTLPVGSTKVFGQPVFAQGTLFVATETHGLYDFAP